MDTVTRELFVFSVDEGMALLVLASAKSTAQPNSGRVPQSKIEVLRIKAFIEFIITSTFRD